MTGTQPTQKGPMAETWIVQQPPAPHETAPLRETLGLHPLVADVLARRGVLAPEQARDFLQPKLTQLHSPLLLKGMEPAVARIEAAIRAGEPIVVSGDYDVDGMGSTALLMRFFADCGVERVQCFIPNRFAHGYGLTPATVEALLEMQPRLVITVDNGITAIDEVAALHDAGVDTVITDHHLPLEAGVPPGIVVNPQQPGCDYPDKTISGCGVAFKLITALRARLRESGWWSDARPEPNLKRYLDLVAIATIADVVPLVGENRVLTQHGLEVLNTMERRAGVAALLAHCRYLPPGGLEAETVAFQIAPRLNAAGRMSDGALAVRLLLEDNPERAADLAQVLEEENLRRRETGDQMFALARDMVKAAGGDPPAIVVAHAEFHEGLIGIIAARLTERFGKPALVMAENGATYKGSARGIPGFHVARAIAAGAEHLERDGGHAGAGGCSVEKNNLAAFTDAFLQNCTLQLQGVGAPPRYLEGQLLPGEVSVALVDQMQALAPFGEGNAAPEFLLRGQQLTAPPSLLKERHLKWVLSPEVEMVGWNMAALAETAAEYDYRVRLGINEFRGMRKAQLTINGHRPAQG